MSFSSDVKAEIAGNIPSSKHCRTASLAALLGCIGRFEGGPEEGYVLFLYTDNREAVRKCFTLLYKAIRISSELCTVADIGRREQRGHRSSLRGDAADGTISGIFFCAADRSAIPARSIIWSGAVPRGNKLRSCRK